MRCLSWPFSTPIFPSAFLPAMRLHTTLKNRMNWALASTIAAIVTAILVAMFVSVTYASFAAPAASALAGCWLAVWRKPDLREHVRGAALAYAALIGGWAFIGCIEPRSPAWWLLAIPWSGVSAAACRFRSRSDYAATPPSIWTRFAITFGLQFIIIGIVIFRLFSTIAHP
mgnify:CR=1 FL=1